MYESFEEEYNYIIGPYLKFDFFEFDNFYFSIIGGVYYSKHTGSYILWVGQSGYYIHDINIIDLLFMPRIAYKINNNVDIYWQFASIGYSHYWGNVNGNILRIEGSLTRMIFGIIFKFGSS